MFGLFKSRKSKAEDTSPAETPVHTVTEARPPDQAGNIPYPLLNSQNNRGNDYDQLYTFMDFTVIGPSGPNPKDNTSSRGDTGPLNYLTNVPFRTAMVSASEMDTVKDLDLLLLQFSTKLSSVQTLVTADYDFSLENQIMDESQVLLTKSDSSGSSTTEQEPRVQQNEDEQMAQLLEFASLS